MGPEVPVGICLAQSLDMIIGLMGILKAGGVYVPLDPTYPNERLAFMLEDARLSVLLTQERLVADCLTIKPKWSVLIQAGRRWPRKSRKSS